MLLTCHELQELFAEHNNFSTQSTHSQSSAADKFDGLNSNPFYSCVLIDLVFEWKRG